MSKAISLAVLLSFVLHAGAQAPVALHNGLWRAALQRKDGNDIAFTFEVKDSAGKKIVYVHNAAERLLADDIRISGDSVIITLPFFESQIRAVMLPGNALKGIWTKRLSDNYQVTPFAAWYNQPFRFPVSGKTATANVAGRYAVLFDNAGNANDISVGEFIQHGTTVTGTLLNPTGDYRYLEGVVDGDSIKLSTFDGGHAYLFTARINADQSLSGGQYFSGPVFKQGGRQKKTHRLPCLMLSASRG